MMSVDQRKINGEVPNNAYIGTIEDTAFPTIFIYTIYVQYMWTIQHSARVQASHTTIKHVRVHTVSFHHIVSLKIQECFNYKRMHTTKAIITKQTNEQKACL